MQEEYIYAVTRVHTQERHLLNEQDMHQLLRAQSVAECYRLLAEQGWGAADVPADDPDALLACEEAKTWALIAELIGDLTPLRALYCEQDYFNLKAAIKLVYTGQDGEHASRYFRQPSTVDAQRIWLAAQQHDFSDLPPELAAAGRTADEVLAHTGNGQACDMILDSAALLAIDAAGKASRSELLGLYARLRVDAANIKAAVRACHMGKDQAFLERMIAPAGSLDTRALIGAAAQSFAAIRAYLAGTEYAQAVDPLQHSLAAFECWCDNRLMQAIRPQRYRYFTIEPLAAYILARRVESAMVRLILSAQANRLGDAVVRARWRQLYV